MLLKGKVGIILGNGKSRQEIDLEIFSALGPIIGCNALYRDFTPDVLVSVDQPMIAEIQKNRYPGIVYRRDPTGFLFSSEKNVKSLKDRGWSAGPTAIQLMTKLYPNVKTILLIGFDIFGEEDGTINNIYAGTNNYRVKKTGHPPTSGWIEQMSTIFRENPKITFRRFGKTTDKLIESWRIYKNVELEEIPPEFLKEKVVSNKGAVLFVTLFSDTDKNKAFSLKQSLDDFDLAYALINRDDNTYKANKKTVIGTLIDLVKSNSKRMGFVLIRPDLVIKKDPKLILNSVDKWMVASTDDKIDLLLIPNQGNLINVLKEWNKLSSTPKMSTLKSVCKSQDIILNKFPSQFSCKETSPQSVISQFSSITDNSKSLKIIVPPGIGDFSWVYSKLFTLGRKINVTVTHIGPARLLQFTDILPNADLGGGVTLDFAQLRSLAVSPNTTRKTLMEANEILHVECNTHLETGNRVETWLPDVPMDYHYPLNITKEHKAKVDALSLPKNFLCIFAASEPTCKAWNGWFAPQWTSFLMDFRKRIVNIPVVIVGADWDKLLSDKIVIHAAKHKINVTNLTGLLPLGSSLEVIKRSSYFVSFPSGLGILSDVIEHPTTMFYPTGLTRMMKTFADPESIKSLRFNEITFPNPIELVTWLKDVYKLQSKIL